MISLLMILPEALTIYLHFVWKVNEDYYQPIKANVLNHLKINYTCAFGMVARSFDALITKQGDLSAGL